MLQLVALLQEEEPSVSFRILCFLFFRGLQNLSTSKGTPKSRCDMRGMPTKFWRKVMMKAEWGANKTTEPYISGL